MIEVDPIKGNRCAPCCVACRIAGDGYPVVRMTSRRKFERSRFTASLHVVVVRRQTKIRVST